MTEHERNQDDPADQGHDHTHHHTHHHTHDDGHGHAHDRGVRAMLRYLRWAPEMWRSEINDAVVDLVAPSAGEHVVDIGAGMGPGAVRAARTGASVTAVEPTPFMRAVLSTRRWFQRNRDRIAVVDGGAEQLPVGDGSVDAVWAVNTMHHWVDPQRGAAEIARVLVPGGRVVLVDEDFDDPAHPDHGRFGGHDDDHDDDHHHGFTMVDAEQMAGWLRSAGLSDVDSSTRQLAGRPVTAVTVRATRSTAP